MNSVNIEFYVNNFCAVNSVEETDISFVPAILKRRFGKLDKCTLFILNSIYSNNCENLVFSSRKGEVERLVKIINQYTMEGEVSPNIFSGSVHNYPAGAFLLNKKKPIPYTAISAGEKSISAGLLAALTSDYKNILYCYADSDNNNAFGMGINISKLSGENKYRLTVQNGFLKESFLDFKELFNGSKNLIETELFKIERV